VRLFAIAPAVAQVAIAAGVARRPLELNTYTRQLVQMIST
jgi:hypothetical protein